MHKEVTEISLFTEEREKNKGNQDHKVKRRFEEMKECTDSSHKEG
jgi:hypothetical protein